MKENSFVAIDFEHLYPAHETACEVGAVRVVNGVITGRFYSTILPPSDYCKGRSNSDIIGLTYEMLKNSPTFIEVYSQLQAFIGNLPWIAHHAATELAILEKCSELYNLTDILGNGDFFDTYDKTGKSLIESCKEYGIPLIEHHNPLHDAEATAQLFLALQRIGTTNIVRGERKRGSDYSAYAAERAALDPNVYIPLADEEVENKNTPFFGKVKTVVTGRFTSFNRNELKAALKALGADINSDVSRKTQILVVGTTEVGPSKIKKAEEYGIRIMYESELKEYL